MASWGASATAGTRWDLGASRIGNQVLASCPKWLIFVEGAGKQGCAPCGCSWGEHVSGAVTDPVKLSDPRKLVYSPHVYDNGGRCPLDEMPGVWYEHFARVQSETGTPVVLGEWGGVMSNTTFQGRTLPSTRAWQEALLSYLEQQQIGFFYWSARSHCLPNDPTPPS